MVKKFTIPFASQGDANDIPDALQADGKVSFTQGFSYDYERPYDDPQAKDIAREDMNGIFKAITSAVGELQTLGASEWSSAIAYPKGAIVYYEKDLYISQVDDNQNEPSQNWVSITSIANDSLKKVANLSDLTNKATARNNLGLGTSATLNKTDVLGTSTSLVATQKLVNDTKINLENSKQDKLTFIGDGKVMREGAWGVGRALDFNSGGGYTQTEGSFLFRDNTYFTENNIDNRINLGVKVQHPESRYSFSVGQAGYTDSKNFYVTTMFENTVKNYLLYHNGNTTTDKSGFLRASGSANALTESDRTSSLGTSTTLVASQKLVNDTRARADSAYDLANSAIPNSKKTSSLGASTDLVATQKLVNDVANTAKNHGIGYGQQWVDVTSQRSAETTYTNNTGKPIEVSISKPGREGSSGALFIDGVQVSGLTGGEYYMTISAVVPPGSKYRYSSSNIDRWVELR